MKKLTSLILLLSALLVFTSCTQEKNLRILYWNIQNGMWDGQTDNYQRFVDWVSVQNPDVCVWCESVTLYITNTAESA